MKIRKMRTDRGAALPTVIMVMLVTFIFASIVLTLTTSQSKAEVTYETNMKALHAAEIGINHYLWYMNKADAEPIPMNTEIGYPEHNPEYIYTLKLIKDKPLEKVIQATGWIHGNPSIKRKVEVEISKEAFTKYVYFSDNDPQGIYWTSNEKCYGPYHSNTWVYIQGKPGPIFFGEVTHVKDMIIDRGSTPTFKQGHRQVNLKPLPKSNTELKIRAKEDGYYYTGLTRIRLNEDGSITVNNNGTTETKQLPKNGVIYVEGTSPEVEKIGTKKFDPLAGNVFIVGTLKGRLTVAASNDIFITDYDPLLDKITNKTKQIDGIKYKDVTFYKDTGSGKVTANPENGGSMLGLIANRNVGVLTYGWFGDENQNIESAKGNIMICAAIMAIDGKFGNSYNLIHENTIDTTYPSDDGILTVWGSICQKKRGIVGQGTRGYDKDYAHDPRLMHDQPPYFLEPDEKGWAVTGWKEK